jgi:two-component SAPR family response regulator
MSRQLKVLCVTDPYAGRVLELAGCDVLVCEGPDALLLAEEFVPDMYLLDTEVATAEVLATSLREQAGNRPVRFIELTGEEPAASGYDERLPKPLHPERLVSAVAGVTRVTDFIRRHPYATIISGFGLGVIVGALLRRRPWNPTRLRL